MEVVANETCQRALCVEGILTDDSCSTEGPIGVTASYDMGWQRRSSGRAYNSRSGHVILVGEITGKVIGYGSRIANCKQCEVNTAKGTNKEHDCRINWDGSAKAMEADLAVELLNSSKTPILV